MKIGSMCRLAAPKGSIIFLLFVMGCASKVLVPPRIDLKSFGRVGILEFTCNSRGHLGQYATQKLIEAIHASQPGTPVLELGNNPEALNFRNIQGIKKQYGVDVLIAGNLVVSNVIPAIDISSFVTSMNVQARVEADLSVKLLDTESGATLWSNSGSSRTSVAEVSFSKDGFVYFGAEDPERAYGNLIYSLIDQVTHDFRPRWVRASQ